MGRAKGSEQAPHRAGPLVQVNKKHKHGKHKTKGMLDSETRGRISSISSIKKKSKKNINKSARRKQADAVRNQKIQEVLSAKRKLGGFRGAPISVAVIPLSPSCDPHLTLQFLVENSRTVSNCLGQFGNTTHIKYNNGKNLTFSVPERGDFWTCLDLMKFSDITLFLLPTLEPINEEAKTLLRCAKDQGLTTSFLGVTSECSKTEEKAFLKSVHKVLPFEKIYAIVNPGQISNLLRMLTVAKVSTPKQFSLRSGMLIETCQAIPVDQTLVNELLPHYPKLSQDFSNDHVLQVSGFIRRRNLNPYNYVHISGAGTYQILRIDVSPVQYPVSTAGTGTPPRFMLDPDNIPESHRQDELNENNLDNVSMVSGDLSDGDFEMDVHSELGMRSKQRLLPKGTSDYQADWLADSDSDKDKDDIFSDNEELESVNSQSDNDNDDGNAEMDWDEEKKEFALAKAAREEAEFPDWIDTPMDQEAKVRFQRYRGLESFKSSTWNPYENLPKEYSQIFQFQNFRHTYKKIMKELEAEDDGFGFIPIGQRVNMILKPIDKSSAMHMPLAGGSPFVALFSLLRHETRTSVINLHLNLNELVKNKEPLIFQVGFRRFQAQPILSDATPGNKHKMLRFGQQSTSCVATIICPVVFPIASVLAFKAANKSLAQVGSGSVSSVDPCRIIVKRVLLSGYPFRCNGRKATVRFMFFNRKDIEWFKPVELKTRYGRRGHINEPLGTHGHMKCVFDGQLKSQDIVLMPLYKRVFPKFNYDEYVPPYAIFD